MSKLVTLAGWIRRGEYRRMRTWLAREAFPPAVFRYADVTLIRCEDVRPPRRAVPGFRARWATPEDEARLQAVHPSRRPYQEKFEAGASCVLGEVGGEPVSCNWYVFDPVHESLPNGYRFQIGARACWTVSLYVRRDQRGSGIFGEHRYGGWELLRQRGVTTTYGATRTDNVKAIAAHETVGFRRVCRFRILRLAGLSAHRVDWQGDVPRRCDRGFGLWHGQAAEPAGAGDRPE